MDALVVVAAEMEAAGDEEEEVSVAEAAAVEILVAGVVLHRDPLGSDLRANTGRDEANRDRYCFLLATFTSKKERTSMHTSRTTNKNVESAYSIARFLAETKYHTSVCYEIGFLIALIYATPELLAFRHHLWNENTVPYRIIRMRIRIRRLEKM